MYAYNSIRINGRRPARSLAAEADPLVRSVRLACTASLVSQTTLCYDSRVPGYTYDHVSKLKAMARDKWNSQDCWPVKVMSLVRLASLQRDYGVVSQVSGYITVRRAVFGRSPMEMADILGFHPSLFMSGVSIWKLNALPTDDQFELRSYTNLPKGLPLNPPDEEKVLVVRQPGRARPYFFDKKNGHELEYPPGLMVEQWELTQRVPATEIQKVLPSQRFTSWV